MMHIQIIVVLYYKPKENNCSLLSKKIECQLTFIKPNTPEESTHKILKITNTSIIVVFQILLYIMHVGNMLVNAT